ncbi:MAG: M48 family metallopeptidase [Opitutaceae bacterium]|jgi:Zn-dependent protease with chaperone function|nr:M48 family metallopeptidase [Opitutaceae bacterium]
MDFFQAQDNARKKSGRLVFLYLAAVVAIILSIYAVLILSLTGASGGDHPCPPDAPFLARYWNPQLFLGTAGITAAVIALGSLFKIISLRGGGGVVARSVGGILVTPNTTDPQKRRLVNVVEEMAVAAGVRVPEIYILPEQGINAFAAGYSPDDAAVAVTQGALDTLTRDELQGVVAHEFSHILNGDMRLNIRLIGLLFGIFLLTLIGRVVLRAVSSSGSRRSGGKKGGGIAIFLILGLALILVGYIGVFFGRIIQAAVSRQREFLADASAVQFTRNPDGIAGALRKIGARAAGSRIANAHATETSHMFFASALRSSFGGLFATHPPLAERIKAIDPSFDGDFSAKPKPPAGTGAGAGEPPVRNPVRFSPLPNPFGAAPPIPSSAFLASLAVASAPNPSLGAATLEAIPPALRETARDPERVRALVLALLRDTADAAVAAKQQTIADRVLATTERATYAAALPPAAALPARARLPLLDLALPALRALPPAQIESFLQAVDAFIAADGRTSLAEFALRRVIQRNLRPPERNPRLATAAAPLAAEISLLLSAIAHAGAAVPESAVRAFAAGAGKFDGTVRPKLALQPVGNADPDALIRALDRLDHTSPAVKKTLLSALAAAAAADASIAPSEIEILRATAAALNCPAPPVR